MKIVLTVFLKELLEFVRDTRSVIITLLLPFLLFPAVFTILGHRSERSYVIYLRDVRWAHAAVLREPLPRKRRDGQSLDATLDRRRHPTMSP